MSDFNNDQILRQWALDHTNHLEEAKGLYKSLKALSLDEREVYIRNYFRHGNKPLQKMSDVVSFVLGK